MKQIETLDPFLSECYHVFKTVQNRDSISATKYVLDIEQKFPQQCTRFWESRFLFGLAFYEANQIEEARKRFFQALNFYPQNELTNFYLANCYLRAINLSEAKNYLDNALKIRREFPEARKNLTITIKSMLQRHIKRFDLENIAWDVSPDIGIDVEDSDACLDIPIFINNRDHIGCLKNLLDWLLGAGYRKIFVLDQESTYPPLLEFYDSLAKDQRVNILKMGNLGFQSIWLSKILEDLDIRTPYVYTDSDVIPTRKVNIVQELLRTLKQNRLAKKVGAKLIVDHITCQNADYYKEIQASYYQESRRISAHEFFMPNDTTFSIYRNVRHYNCVFSIVRTDLEIRHLPWYYDSNNLPEDEKYYVEHANKSSTFAQDIKEQVSSIFADEINSIPADGSQSS